MTRESHLYTYWFQLGPKNVSRTKILTGTIPPFLFSSYPQAAQCFDSQLMFFRELCDVDSGDVSSDLRIKVLPAADAIVERPQGASVFFPCNVAWTECASQVISSTKIMG